MEKRGKNNSKSRQQSWPGAMCRKLNKHAAVACLTAMYITINAYVCKQTTHGTGMDSGRETDTLQLQTHTHTHIHTHTMRGQEAMVNLHSEPEGVLTHLTTDCTESSGDEIFIIAPADVTRGCSSPKGQLQPHMG